MAEALIGLDIIYQADCFAVRYVSTLFRAQK